MCRTVLFTIFRRSPCFSAGKQISMLNRKLFNIFIYLRISARQIEWCERCGMRLYKRIKVKMRQMNVNKQATTSQYAIILVVNKAIIMCNKNCFNFMDNIGIQLVGFWVDSYISVKVKLANRSATKGEWIKNFLRKFGLNKDREVDGRNQRPEICSRESFSNENISNN